MALDPSDDDWSHATDIVRHITSKKLGKIGLRSWPLPCAMVDTTMSVAEITPNVLECVGERGSFGGWRC